MFSKKEKVGIAFGIFWYILYFTFFWMWNKKLKEKMYWEFGTENPSIALLHIVNRQAIKHLDKKEKS